MRTGLFFGSFNPIHVGHLAIAQYMVVENHVDELWFVVSPHNPHKDKKKLLDQHERLHMVEIAIRDTPYFRSNAIEFDMPQPSYTYDSLQALQQKYPERDFCVILGSDSLKNLPKWKNGDEIAEKNTLLVYPRPGFRPDAHHFDRKNIKITNAPLLDISSTAIRASIRNKKPLSHMLHKDVWEYLDKQLHYVD